MRLMLTILGISLLCFGCKPNRDVPCRKVFVDSIAVDASLLGLTPYINRDSALFRFNNSDSIYISVNLFPADGNKTQVIVNPECPPDEIYYKATQIMVGDSSISNNFHAQMILDGLTKSLTININNFKSNFSESTINSGSPFADSLLIENVSYKRVFRITNSTDTLYFNKSSGIIKVISKNNIWQLLR
ncbi:MAG: hypothetical protein ACK5FU_09030 [Bacteroidota bacterium]|jgi:hypothetical protein